MRFLFCDCELDTRQHVFRRNGRDIALEPQVFDLLALFARRAGKLVDRDVIMQEIWNGRIVSEATVSSRINAVRNAIGDDGKAQRFLQTVPRRGFRFIAEVTEADGADAPGQVAPAPAQEQRAPQIRYARSADGARIAWASAGEGPPLMRAGHFLTHLEMDWKSAIFGPLLSRLAAQYTVTRYDQRSTGLSEPHPPSLSLDALIDDMEAVARAAGLQRFPIFATSQGVPVAIGYALRHPDRVTGLVLHGGYAQGRIVRGTQEDIENAEAIQTLIRQGWGRSGGAFAKAFVTVYCPDATGEQLDHLTELQLASTTPENAVALRRAIDGFDVSARLHEVGVPTLVLHADGDSVQPLDQSMLIASEIPGATMHVLRSRNHILLPQHPSFEEAMDAATRFLSAL